MGITLTDQCRANPLRLMSVVAAHVAGRHIQCPQKHDGRRGKVFTVGVFVLQDKIRDRVSAPGICGQAVLIIAVQEQDDRSHLLCIRGQTRPNRLRFLHDAAIDVARNDEVACTFVGSRCGVDLSVRGVSFAWSDRVAEGVGVRWRSPQRSVGPGCPLQKMPTGCLHSANVQRGKNQSVSIVQSVDGDCGLLASLWHWETLSVRHKYPLIQPHPPRPLGVGIENHAAQVGIVADVSNAQHPCQRVTQGER